MNNLLSCTEMFLAQSSNYLFYFALLSCINKVISCTNSHHLVPTCNLIYLHKTICCNELIISPVFLHGEKYLNSTPEPLDHLAVANLRIASIKLTAFTAVVQLRWPPWLKSLSAYRFYSPVYLVCNDDVRPKPLAS